MSPLKNELINGEYDICYIYNVPLKTILSKYFFLNPRFIVYKQGWQHLTVNYRDIQWL